MGDLPTLSSRLESAPFLADPRVRALFNAIGRDGDEIRVVGGAVRDVLLRREREGEAEIDFATTALPPVVEARAQAAGLKTIPTGIEHGTVTVLVAGTPFQVTTLREDVETDGRHAVVKFGRSWDADARRRDFTMNALSVGADGVVHDPVGGFDDLLARRVRFIGDPDRRIAEDRLRLLRFFRFQAEISDGPIDREGFDAATRGRWAVVELAAERIAHEMRRLVLGKGAVAAAEAMQDAGVLPVVFAGIGYVRQLDRMIAFEAAAGLPPSATRRLAALTARIPEDAARVAARLKLSNAERDAIIAAVDAGSRLAVPPADQAGRAALYRLGPDRLRDGLGFAASIGTGAVERWTAPLAALAGWTVPVFPVGGNDLLGLGYPRGPEVGTMLRDLEEWWIDRDFQPDRKTLLNRAQQMAAAQ